MIKKRVARFETVIKITNNNFFILLIRISKFENKILYLIFNICFIFLKEIFYKIRLFSKK
jgi:hypothetical protein